MPKKKSVFAGGWNQNKADQLEKVQVPEKIRCSVCKKVKVAETYSKRQLGDLKHHIALGNDPKHSNIRCRICTGVQIHEMTCVICGQSKSLEGFSKAQRRTPDSARCYECLNDHLALRPGIKLDWDESTDEEDSEGVGDSEGSVTNNYEELTLGQTASDIDGVAASMQKLTAQNLEYHGASQDLKAEPSVDSTELSSVVSNKDKMPARSTANNRDVGAWNSYAKANSKRVTEYTGFDSAGVAHHRVRSPSTVASDDYKSSKAPGGSKFARVKSSQGGRVFAKPIRSPTPPLLPVITRDVVGRQVDYSESSSDDEWGVIH